MRRAGIAALAFVAMAGAGSAMAQLPKTTDGKRDLSGVWHVTTAKYVTDLAAAGRISPFQPWGAALYKERQSTAGKDRPSTRCQPRGLPGSMLIRDQPWKIVQTPGTIVMIFDELLHYRQIFMDGRGLPTDPVPAWFGYSIGKWDGETLVVDTTGFHELTWLDDGGRPHSDAMRLTERFRRRSASRLDVDLTIDDPKAYVRPWTATLRFELAPETALGEHVCGTPVNP